MSNVPNRFAVVQAMEAEGLFDKARSGDIKACALFARLAAYRMNPTGDRSSWGWLSKSGGEEQHAGFSVDAIVYGDDPSNLSNVVDLIGGAGASGASIAWQEKPRRASNQWVKPEPLSADELAYLGGATQPGSGTTTPPPQTCAYDKAAIAKLTQDVNSLRNDIAHYREALDAVIAMASRMDQAWAERVWNALDPEQQKPPTVEVEFPTYSGKVLGQRFTLTPNK